MFVLSQAIIFATRLLPQNSYYVLQVPLKSLQNIQIRFIDIFSPQELAGDTWSNLDTTLHLFIPIYQIGLDDSNGWKTLLIVGPDSSGWLSVPPKKYSETQPEAATIGGHHIYTKLNHDTNPNKLNALLFRDIPLFGTITFSFFLGG